MFGFFLTALLLTATPLYAAEDRAVLGTDVGRLASDLLDKTTPEKLLRGLFDQALATIQDYIEVDGSLPSQDPWRSGEFHVKLFPQGKSHSQEHVGADGSFHLSPESDQQEFTLRFKSSKPSQRSASPPSGDIL
jgi:hypothetical protein